MTAATWERVGQGATRYLDHRARMRSGGWLAVARNDDGSWRWGVYIGPGQRVAEGVAATWQRARALAESAATNLGHDLAAPPATVSMLVELDEQTLAALDEYRAYDPDDPEAELITDRVLDLALALLDQLDERTDEVGR